MNLSNIPSHMHTPVREYVERGAPIGGFLAALFSNDFLGVYKHADDPAAMFQWASFLYNEVPAGCHGSPEAVEKWQKAGGLIGVQQARRAETDRANAQDYPDVYDE